MKRYTLDVQENDDGDCYVQFPDELMEELGWKAGDLLEYTEDEYGSLYLQKIEDTVSKNRKPKTALVMNDIEQISKNFEMIAQAIENLAKRISALEEAMGQYPPPGANMIQYKPPGKEEYMDMKELFDDIYARLPYDDRLPWAK